MDARSLIALLLLATCSVLPAAQGEPLPAAVVADLQAAQAALGEGDAEAALAALAAHAEIAHPDVLTLRALAHQAAGQEDLALEAYRGALALDRERQDLVLAMLNIHLGRDDDAALLVTAGEWLDRDRAPEGALLLAAQAARRLEDASLAQRYATLAQLRFPQSEQARRMLAALALDRGDAAEARVQIDWLLRRHPTDPELWRMLAWLEEDAAERRRLLELALLAGHDPELHRAWVAALSAAGHHGEALAQLETLDLTDSDARDLALQVAIAAGDEARAGAILARIPADERTVQHHRVAARLALEADDAATARAALRRLIELGAADEAVLLQAARLAEDRGAPAEAEALYRQAAAEGSVSARLYLARLLIQHDRKDEARELLARLAAERPELTVARQMLALLEGDG